MGLKFLEEIKQGIRSASLKKDIICYYINNGDDTLADLGKELNFSVPTVTNGERTDRRWYSDGLWEDGNPRR